MRAESFLDVGGLPLTDPPAKIVVESIDECVQGNLLYERLDIGVGVGIRSDSEKENVVCKGAQRLSPLTTTASELCTVQADEIALGERHAGQRSRRGWLLASPEQDAELVHEDENLPPRLIVPSVDGGRNIKILQPGLEVVTGFAVEQLGHDERTVKGSVAIHCCEKKKTDRQSKKKKKKNEERREPAELKEAEQATFGANVKMCAKQDPDETSLNTHTTSSQGLKYLFSSESAIITTVSTSKTHCALHSTFYTLKKN